MPKKAKETEEESSEQVQASSVKAGRKLEEKAEEKEEKAEKKVKKKTAEEFEKRVIELAESGLTAEKIGEALRKEDIHSKDYGKKISQILGSRYIQPDEKNLQKKLDNLQKHTEKNKSDKKSIREKQRISATLRRLRNYLKK
jgi:ribosomal protein S15P/S13E